ncbi:MAG: hypothetical protein JXA44_08335 [Methanospirillaceae archaeon]|nr:hypothetical protein [Methanospirillaceae archaeon]
MVSSLITSAIGLIIILIAGYVVATGILVTSETVIGAQKEMSAIQSDILNTGITITNTDNETDWVALDVENSGNSVISDLGAIDIYVLEGTTMTRYTNNTPIITPTSINPGYWDPGETLNISTTLNTGPYPKWVKVATPNGITASAYL